MPHPPETKPKKPRGRPKGFITNNRKELMAKAKELNVDPFEILLRFAAEDWEGLGYDDRLVVKYTPQGKQYYEFVIPPELRVESAQSAARYILPSLKSIDVNTDDADKNLNVTINLAGGHVAKGGSKPPGTDETPA